MPRHQGTIVNVAERVSIGRQGQVFPLDAMEVAGGVLYYAHEMPPAVYIRYLERWVVPEQHWVINRFTLREDRPAPEGWIPGYHWYVDLDRVTVTGDVWRMEDGYLDVIIYDGDRYELLDADELADALRGGDIPAEDAILALQSLDAICRDLRRLGFSGRALLDQYAPGLPR
jgi:predicted RNA-binding protein associated with RNAse of E/G family